VLVEAERLLFQFAHGRHGHAVCSYLPFPRGAGSDHVGERIITARTASLSAATVMPLPAPTGETGHRRQGNLAPVDFIPREQALEIPREQALELVLDAGRWRRVYASPLARYLKMPQESVHVPAEAVILAFKNR